MHQSALFLYFLSKQYDLKTTLESFVCQVFFFLHLGSVILIWVIMSVLIVF